MTTLELAKNIANLLDNRKASDVKILKIEELTVIADYFVICTGTSTTHVRALANEIEYKLKETGTMPLSIQGYQSSNWILLDYGAVVVHVFLEETRGFYALERLWGDAPVVELQLGE